MHSWHMYYDVVNPIGGYLGYVGEKPLTREELCRQLIGAGTGFVGSVGGASVGSYAGTWILPGWGTLIGGTIGGNVGYSFGKEFGVKVIGEICPAILANALYEVASFEPNHYNTVNNHHMQLKIK